MTNATILWADDEIDLLKPHILYLEEKGYQVVPVTSGRDALDVLLKDGSIEWKAGNDDLRVDMVFLDEQMPGLSGIDTLKAIKERWPQLPVVMITKSEEENIMDDALGGKISDYLIKPVSPSQLLLTVKKHTEGRRLQSEHSSHGYQQQFREIGMQLGDCRTAADWEEMYRRLVFWDLDLASSEDENVHDIFLSQRREANAQFARFYESHYLDWLAGREEKPLMSHTVVKERLVPLLKEGKEKGGEAVFLIVIDNFRYDQWKYVQPTVEQLMRVKSDELYYTILPTTTQFARNAMFAGLMPSEIERKYPQWWVNEDEEGYKNQYEEQLLAEQLRRHGLNVRLSYNKVLNAQYGRRLVERVPDLMHNDLNVVIYNFVDMLSHASTDSHVVRELADSDRAYRSLTLSWMEHSPLMELLKTLSEKDVTVIITTDHGSTRVERPVRVKGDREVSVNLRYKQGRLLDYPAKEVFEVKEPAKLFLPRRHVTSPYIFARPGDFFAYPNNYNQYVQLYTGTFQHGGVSMEESLVPWVTMGRR